MHEAIQRIVGKSNVTDSEPDLAAYSYDASCLRLKPELVAWPTTEEDVGKTIAYCNRANLPIVCRGRGTNIVGSAIGDKSVVLDFSKMSRIIKLNIKENYAVVEPGITVQELNQVLKAEKKFFPVFPEEMTTTLGGILASNLFGPYAQGLGRIREWTLGVEYYDGTGKYYDTPETEDIIGWEGTTGIITKIKLKLCDWPLAKSLELLAFKNLPLLLKKAGELARNRNVLSLEFFNRTASAYLGFGSKYTLMTEYLSDEGAIRDKERIRHLLQKRHNTSGFLRLKKYYCLEDPKVPFEKLYDLIEWSEKHNLPCYGQIGLGTLKIMFKKEDHQLIEELHSLIRDLNGFASGIFGYGLKKKRFFPPGLKHRLMKIKEIKDYNNILNRGKLIDFK